MEWSGGGWDLIAGVSFAFWLGLFLLRKHVVTLSHPCVHSGLCGCTTRDMLVPSYSLILALTGLVFVYARARMRKYIEVFASVSIVRLPIPVCQRVASCCSD